MDLEMNDEEAEAKLANATEAAPIDTADVDEESQEKVNSRLKALFGGSDIWNNFIAPPSPTKGKRKEKAGGRLKKGRMTEEEEDKLMLASSEKETSKKVVERLEKQPSILTGTTLRYYQLEGLNWMIKLFNNGISGILADEMGLGKTIQSISMLCFLKEFMGIDGKHLILVPKSCLGNWMNEFKKWAPSQFRMIAE
jgi:SWI/SNF-related matrix-associated actin-dependent regulator of chromatin subfamily A member 5